MNHGWETMKSNFLRLFLTIIVLGFVAIPMGLLEQTSEKDTVGAAVLGVIAIAYMFLLMPVFQYGAKYLFLQGVRGEVINVKDILKGFDRYLNIVLAQLLVMSLIALGLVALLVPGIIVACRLVFVPFLVMDKDLDPVAAVEESWRMTNGLGWTIFGMAIVSILICIGGLILLAIGIFPAIIWAQSAFASIYQAALLKSLRNGQEQEPMAS
jgi:uncharacterized membrane protein